MTVDSAPRDDLRRVGMVCVYRILFQFSGKTWLDGAKATSELTALCCKGGKQNVLPVPFVLRAGLDHVFHTV